MKRYLLYWERAKSIMKRSDNGARRIWKSYGYYISLACLLTVFGIAAYVYKNNNTETTQYRSPVSSNEVAAMSMAAVQPAPTIEPVPYAPHFRMPADGHIICEYSDSQLVWSTTLGQWCVHNGIDIAANTGTAVFAAEDGTVASVYSDDLYGNVIELVHGDGWVTRYCALETQLAQTGTDVKKGDVIGSVGNSAICENGLGPHLHFEVMRDGEHLEPVFE